MNDAPEYISATRIWALRGERARAARFEGLYVLGEPDALAAPTVAIVGSRAASEHGRRIAWRFAAALGKAGVCVISGLALGIDGAAHAGALSAGAPTIGVLGGGHRRFFPPRNRELAFAMVAKGGAILSPFGPDEPALPGRFLQRNGIIASLADAVVVIEAAARSGSLNTAAWAAASNVPVLAVPGDIDRPKVAGCHALIRDGAVLVRDVDDIFEAIGISPRNTSAGPQALPLPFAAETPAGRIVAALAQEAYYVEDLSLHLDMTVPDLLAALTQLVVLKIVSTRDNGAYQLTEPAFSTAQ